MHPVLAELGSVTIYSYGAFVALAVAVSWVYARWLSRRLQVSAALAADVLFIGFSAGVLGARLFYVAQRWSEFSSQPWRAFALQEGGLVWYGGFFGGLLAGATFLHLKRQPKIFWADFFACILPVAHGIGRLGCFMNGCCHGKFMNDQTTHHPVQLYETFFLTGLSIALFVVLTRFYKKGRVLASYLVGYGTIRFGLEFFRGDQALLSGLTLPQWLSLGLVIVGLVIYPRERR